MVVATTACSGGSKKVASAPVQFVTPASSPSIDQAQSVNLSVAVADGSPVTWSLQVGFGIPAGTLSNQTGTTVTYNAPASVSSETQVTVVATAGANSAAMAVFVEPAPQVTGTSFQSFPSCPNPGSLILSTSPGTVSIGQTLGQGQYNVLSSGGVPPFTWSVASGSLPTGLSLSLGTDTSKAGFVGSAVSSGCSIFTLQVTDAAGVSATSQPIHLVVIPAAIKVSAPNIGEAFVDAANTGVPFPPVQFAASNGTPPYRWSLSAGAGGQTEFPPGLVFSSTGVLSGVPDPSGLIQNGGFGAYSPTIVASDSQAPYPATVLATVGMTVTNSDTSCPSGAESSLTTHGPYAFLLRGFDAKGPVTISGNFTVDGAGAITGGSEDIMRSTGAQTGLSIVAGSTYTLGLTSNRGCVTLTNSAGTTTTFRIAMGGCSSGRNSQGSGCQTPTSGSSYFTTGHMLEFDDSTGLGTHVSGIVRLQDSSTFQNSGISGPYAFGLSGWDSVGGRVAIAGSANAGSTAWGAVAADINDAGVMSSSLTGGSGAFAINANGRGTGTLSIGNLSLNLILYPVSSHEVMVATSGSLTAANPILSGEALSTAGSFSAQSLQNTHMFHIAGVTPTSGMQADPSVGTLSFDGIGIMSGTEYENQAGTLGTTALSGTYSVDATTGRFFFAQAQGQNLGTHPLVGYVIPAPANLTATSCNVPAACVTGFLVSTDSSAQAGVLEFQIPATAPPPPFSLSSIVGNYVYGTDEALDRKTTYLAGFAFANPASSRLVLNQEADYSDPQFCMDASCVLLIPNAVYAGSYSVKNDGSGSFGGQTVSVTNGSVTFFVDESPLNSHPAIITVEE